MDTSEAADRRRAIELILDRRPDVDVDALADVLHQLDFAMDEATLLADLEALGFEVDDGHGEGVRDGSDGSVGGTDGSAATSDAAPLPVSKTISGPSTMPPGSTGTGGPVPRSAGMIGAVMVLVGALLLAAILAGGGDEGDDAGSGAPVATTAPLPAAPSGDPGGTAPAPVEANPLGPGADPALGDGVDGSSDFEGPDAPGLEGTAPGDLTWDIVSGEWSVAAGQARLAPVPDAEVALALIDPGLTEYRVQVRLPILTDNVGLAFWADDTGQGWMFVASPTYSSFNLVRVRDGSFEVIDNTGLTTTEDRTATIGLHVTGRRVEGLVNGDVLVTHDITEDPPGTRFGLGGLPSAGESTFDDLAYKADG